MLTLITALLLYRKKGLYSSCTMSKKVNEIPATRTAEKCGRKRDFYHGKVKLTKDNKSDNKGSRCDYRDSQKDMERRQC